MQKANEAVDTARFNIKIELDMCDKDETPFLCSLISSSKGYEQAVNTILEIVGNRGFTIAMAIAEQERLLNPRYSDD